MKSAFYSTATFGVVLLLGATGLGRRALVADPQGGSAPQATTLVKQTTAPGASGACKKDDSCDDPVVRAGKLGKQEADDALKIQICNFLGLRDEDIATSQQRGAPRNNDYCRVTQRKSASGPSVAEDGPLAVDQAVQPKVVIAVLPDPVHTQLALRFDQSVDELENSIQDLGWIYDRAWLPWDPKDHEDEIDFDKRMENKVAQEEYESSPGAIMFRTVLNKGATQPLIVLVVGDTPTGGVNQTTFRSAIEIWKQLTGLNNFFGDKSAGAGYASNPSDAAELDILGPTYSGSVPSLKALLRELTAQIGSKQTVDGYLCPSAKKKFTVWVSSGTVSDEEELYDLSSTPQERTDRFAVRLNDCSNLRVVVTSMAADSNNEWLRIVDFIKKHQALFTPKNAPVRVAQLTEAESSFGDLNISFDQHSLDVITRVKSSSALSDTERTWLDSLRDTYRPYAVASNLLNDMQPLHFYFPREISKLRTAYEENKIFGFNTQSNTVQTQLHLSLGGNTHDDDTVHTFSGTEGAAAMEAAMSQLASELGRSKVDIVVLSATDVLDEIFVTRYLAQHAPNIAVIVTDTDGLFLRSGDSSMQNTYVISPWPLLPGNEEWSAPDPETAELPPVRLHDSAGGQGLYNAVRYLICVPASQPMDMCGAVPNPAPKIPQDAYLRKVTLPEYQTPVATWAAKNNHLITAPPLWLSVVERGGFWPISLVDLDQADDGMPGQAELLGEYRRTLPLLTSVDYRKDGRMQAHETQGIHESTPIGIVIAACLIALLLGAHGLACFHARLDRTYAWTYALADEKHHRLRLCLQMALALSAVPALVLLKTPNEAGIFIRDHSYTAFNWFVQFLAVLLACWPLAQWVGLWPWPAVCREKIEAWMEFGWRLMLVLVLWFACNRWLWDAIAPSMNKWPSERAFFFYRSGHLFGGSAPVLPLLLLAGAVVAFLLSIFDRLVFYADRIPQLPEMSSHPDLHCPSLQKLKRLDTLLAGRWNCWHWSLLGAVVGSLALLAIGLGLRDVVPRSLTHGRFDVVVIAMSGLVTFLLLYDLAVAFAAWTLLRIDCLQPLARSPLRWGFTWIKGWSWRRMWALGGISPDTVLDYLRRLAEANRRAMFDPWLLQAFDNLRIEIAREPKKPTAKWATAVTRRMGLLHRAIAASALTKLLALRAQWQQDFGPITGTDVKNQGLVERGLREQRPLEKYELPRDATDWRATHDRMAKEEFVAMLYLGYIRMVLLQIRNRIVTATAMYILLLWGLTSYPFLNHHSIVTFLTFILIGLAAAVIWIYAQMHRDEILSRTTETDTGKLDADFFTKVLSMVGIPLVTLIASQFPEVSSALFSWLEPGLSAMK